MGDHRRYEELAVGHVLGGLDDVDQAEFRTHLLTCRDCRVRVAELRDIASSMEAAEREERTAARVKMEVLRREEESAPDEAPRWGIRTLRGAVGAMVAVAAVVGLLVWNFHVRDVNRALLSATEARETVLTLLATGEPLAVAPIVDGVAGVAAYDQGTVAVDLAGLPAPESGEWFGVWLLDAVDEPILYLPYPGAAVDDGVFAAVVQARGAHTLLFTLERGEATGRTTPEGTRLATVDLGR